MVPLLFSLLLPTVTDLLYQQESTRFLSHAEQLASRLLEIAAQCTSYEEVKEQFSQLVHSPLLPEGLGRSVGEAIMVSFSHALAQLHQQEPLSDEQCSSWRTFIHWGEQCLSSLLDPDGNGENPIPYFLLLLL